MVKRAAEDQISSLSDFEKLEETQNSGGTWQKADEEELAKRRIVKVKRPDSSGVSKIEAGALSKGGKEDEGGGSSNPFAGVKLVKCGESNNGTDGNSNDGKELKAVKLPEVSTEIANAAFTKSPEKSATSLSSGGLSISIPSPSMMAGLQSGKSFGGSSPALNSAKFSTLTPGSRTPGGGKKVNPFSGQSPKGNPNPFLSVQDDGNKNNDMWRKLSGSKRSPSTEKDSSSGSEVKSASESSSDKAGIAERTTQKANSIVAGSIAEASIPPIANPFIISSSSSIGTGSSASFATGFSGFASVSSGGGGENMFANGGVFSKGSGSSGGDGGFISSSTLVGTKGDQGNGGSWLFNKSSGNSFLDSIKDNKVDALFGSRSASDGGIGTNSETALGDTKLDILAPIAPAATTTTSATAGAGAGAQEDEDGAAEAQSEEHTMHTAYGKTYAMVGGPVLTGEENENCLLQVRAKLFKLSVTVPALVDSDEDDERNGGAAEEKDNDKDKGKEHLEWAEVGVGPLRVLKAKDGSAARLVMRREDKKGGQGTKVILNIKIREYTSARKQGEKALCVSTFVPITAAADAAGAGAASESTESAAAGAGPLPISYMLRCKLASETSQLASAIEEEIKGAKA